MNTKIKVRGFSPKAILETMETMRRPNGAFIASSSPDYNAMWIRDTLYATFSYYYIGEYEKLKEGMWVIFDLFKRYSEKIEKRIAVPPQDISDGIIHAKYHPDTLDEIVKDDMWGHHQLDALGLFLYIVADLDFKNIRLIRDSDDIKVLKILIDYLRIIEYWNRHDYGIWEECKLIHSSSVGAVVGGLSYIKKQRFFDVHESLIHFGLEKLRWLRPFESRFCPADFHCSFCDQHQQEIKHHSHDCDASQLTLIWPYHVVVNHQEQDLLLSRLIDGHLSENNEYHRLVQTHGLNRYWGDNYYRSYEGKYNGISAEWLMFFFWLSIVYSQRHEEEKAIYWFYRGSEQIVNNMLSEAYQNGKPNNHTPLAWSHAIALIAWSKLPTKEKMALFDM